ncbi:MAG: ABC transporter permease [Desulfobacteraceae bacterium]|nr:ABC transporter permease [Desulfobacteraceae bacterium]MBC2753784.1 ABC transporter permease [Desulfobacteraceae bacterium]
MNFFNPSFHTLKHLYLHQAYIGGNAFNELRYRHAGTGLGIFWNICQPILELTVYTVIFSWLFPRTIKGMPFILYLSSGLFVWRSFASCILRGSIVYREKAPLIGQTTFPPEIHIAEICISSVLVSFIYYALLIPLVLLFGAQLSPTLFILPVVLILFQAMAFTFNLMIAPLCVLIPDIREIIQTLMPLWFWTLPIIYPETILPPHWQKILYLNPPYVFIKSVQDIVLYQSSPTAHTWLAMMGWLSVLLLTGALVHAKLQNDVRESL